MSFLFLFIIPFLISLILLSLSVKFLRKYLVDSPNIRSSHLEKKGKGGGYIFVLNSIFTSIVNLDISLILSIPLALIGLLDDKINLSRKFRFFSQLATVNFILYFIGIPSYFNFLPNYFIFPFFVLVGISFINFTNFMDGIDGIVTGCFLVILIMASIFLNHIYIPMVSSLLAFLIFNWQPSKLFMGDIGSTFLGAIFFTMILQCKNIEQFFAFLMISCPLMLDALTCVIRRYLKGKDIFSPHRDHLYQRLCDNNFSHSKVAFLYIFTTLLISIIYYVNGFLSSLFITLLSIILGIIIDKKLALKLT